MANTNTGSVVWIDVAEIETSLNDGTDEQGTWDSLTPEQRQIVAENVYDDLICSDVIWTEYHRAIDKALAEVQA